jgi:hypothetical protein
MSTSRNIIKFKSYRYKFYLRFFEQIKRDRITTQNKAKKFSKQAK